jgi:hypothetical protein
VPQLAVLLVERVQMEGQASDAGGEQAETEGLHERAGRCRCREGEADEGRAAEDRDDQVQDEVDVTVLDVTHQRHDPAEVLFAVELLDVLGLGGHVVAPYQSRWTCTAPIPRR